jgi:hypothetical protein
MKVVA